MKVTITGSLGNISKPLAQTLIGAGHTVTIISSSENKKSEIEALGATAAIGSINDIDFLTKAYTGADVIYTMVPPNFAAASYRQYAVSTGNNYAAAIKAAGVKRVVNLSSIGAHLADGTGPIKGLHDVEGILNNIDGLAIKHLRPAFFYINFFSNIGMVKQLGILGSNYGADITLVMVHPRDIAAAAAEEIEGNFTGKSVRYVASDERKAGEVATVLGTAIGKPDLQWVAFSDEQALGGMLQAGLPEEMANLYVEMGVATGNGKLFEDYYINKPALSKTKLEDFAIEFAGSYKA